MSDSNIKNILITGSSGLLGSELIHQLLSEEQFSVIAMTSQVEKLKNKYFDKEIIVVPNETWVEELNEKGIQIDTLINCAFPRSSDPKELASGILFTENLIKQSIDFGIHNIINISSQSVYTQKQKVAATEESTVQPESLYGVTKFACERIVALLGNHYNINYSNIRLGSLTSVDFDVRMTNKFVKSALIGEKILIYGGQQQLSYLDVRDAARGLIQMLKSDPNEWKTIYNLGNEENYSLMELIETIKDVSLKFDVERIDIEIKDGDSNYNNLMNNSLFYKQFAFQPEITLENMIAELFQNDIKSSKSE